MTLAEVAVNITDEHGLSNKKALNQLYITNKMECFSFTSEHAMLGANGL